MRQYPHQQKDGGIVMEAEVWKEKLAECQASGKTNEEWCKEQGIPYSTYRYWKGKLTQKNQVQQWAEVKLPETPSRAKEIHLHCGKWNIAVGEEFSPGLLADVLRVVDRVCC